MDTLGPYLILRILGSGGMGHVYAARHAQLDREVALKVIRSEVVEIDSGRERFLREARLMAQIAHPNVVKIYDFGQLGDCLYIAMELLQGKPLITYLRDRPTGRDQVLDLALSMARGVGALHEAGIIHRDLKPANLFVTKDGVLKVLDLGLATGSEMTALTRAGQVSGTPQYMAPESLTTLPTEPTYDVYQMGLVLHLLVVGKEAYPQPTIQYFLQKTTPPPPAILEHEGDHHGLEPIILRCLETAPRNRYANGAALEKAILDVASPPARAPARRASGAVADRSRPAGSGSYRSSSRNSQPRPPAVLPAPSRRWLAAAAPVLAIAVLSICAAAWIHLTRPQPPPAPVSPAPGTPAASVAAPARAGWHDTSAPAHLVDPIVPERAWDRTYDPVEHLPVSLKVRIPASPFDMGVRSTKLGLRTDVEYWPRVPLTPEQVRAVVIHPVSDPGRQARIRGEVPERTRWLRLSLRAGETYRIRVAGETETMALLSCRAYQRLDVHPGYGSALMLHFSQGRPVRLVVMRKSDGTVLEPVNTGRQTLRYVNVARFRDLRDGEEIVAVALPEDPASRMVLGRWTHRVVTRETLSVGARVWFKSLEPDRLDMPNLVGEGFRQYFQKQADAQKEMVYEGRRYFVPEVMARTHRLLTDSRPGVRRGALALIGLFEGGPVDTIDRFMAVNRENADWIQGVEALARSGEPRAVRMLMERFRKGDAEPSWAPFYALFASHEMLPWLADPERAARELPARSRDLMDQVAICMLGAQSEGYLVSLPRQRLLSTAPESPVLSLVMMGTGQAESRLRELAEP